VTLISSVTLAGVQHRRHVERRAHRQRDGGLRGLKSLPLGLNLVSPDGQRQKPVAALIVRRGFQRPARFDVHAVTAAPASRPPVVSFTTPPTVPVVTAVCANALGAIAHARAIASAIAPTGARAPVFLL
jgi:hypothetical protein